MIGWNKKTIKVNKSKKLYLIVISITVIKSAKLKSYQQR